MRRLYVLIALSAVSTTAAARPTAPAISDDGNEAKQHFDTGERDFNLGRFTEAADEFKMAYEISGERSLLFNVAQSYLQAQNREQACLFYKTYLAAYARRHLTPPNEREVQARLVECAAPASATVAAPASTGGAQLTPAPLQESATVAPMSSAGAPPSDDPNEPGKSRLYRVLGTEGLIIGSATLAIGGGLVGVGAHEGSLGHSGSSSYEAGGAVMGAIGLGLIVAGTVAIVRAHHRAPLWLAGRF